MLGKYSPTIYSASKIWHAERWRYLRDNHHLNIIASWINFECGTKENPSGAKALTAEEKAELWLACSKETSIADLTLVYAEEGDEMRGVLVEMGSALGNEKPVYVIGDCASFRACAHSDVAFMYHPLTHRVKSKHILGGAFEAVLHYLDNYAAKQAHKSLQHFA